MRTLVNYLLMHLFLIALFSCNSNPVTPSEVHPGRRDYVWTADTLPNYSYMGKLWGSSPSDVWAIGAAGSYSNTIYHFDGNKWSTDGIHRFISPHSIFGFAKNNVETEKSGIMTVMSGKKMPY